MSQRIVVAQYRSTVWSKEEAQALIQAEQDAHGTARVALSYHAGRREPDGRRPYFVWGTVQFPVGEPPTTVAPPPAATGPTTRLKGSRIRKRSPS